MARTLTVNNAASTTNGRLLSFKGVKTHVARSAGTVRNLPFISLPRTGPVFKSQKKTKVMFQDIDLDSCFHLTFMFARRAMDTASNKKYVSKRVEAPKAKQAISKNPFRSFAGQAEGMQAWRLSNFATKEFEHTHFMTGNFNHVAERTATIAPSLFGN